MQFLNVQVINFKGALSFMPYHEILGTYNLKINVLCHSFCGVKRYSEK
jgi:hypothetical protein